MLPLNKTLLKTGKTLKVRKLLTMDDIYGNYDKVIGKKFN